MSQRVGVLVHGAERALGDRLVGAVATGDGLGEVRAVEAVGGLADVELACRRLTEVCDVVVGLGAAPWPGWALWHQVARDALGALPYWAVETWHALPELADALVESIGPGWVDGSRVLLTAPDAAVRALPAEQRSFMRDVAAALHERTSVRATVAMDRSPSDGPVTPTAVTTVTTLSEAHGATRLVRCTLEPAAEPDDAVTAAAAAAGVTLVDVALPRAAQAALVLAAVRTLLATAPVTAGEQPA